MQKDYPLYLQSRMLTFFLVQEENLASCSVELGEKASKLTALETKLACGSFEADATKTIARLRRKVVKRDMVIKVKHS